MALTESKVLAQITVLPQANAIQVRWDNIIQRDGVEISRVPHRTAYGKGQRDAFLAEVEGASNYGDLIDWTPVV